MLLKATTRKRNAGELHVPFGREDRGKPEGSPLPTLHSEVGRASYTGKGLTGIRNMQRKHLPDM